MPPLLAFLIGVMISEINQWGMWILGHPGRGKLGYFKDGVPHFMIAWGTCIMGWLFWYMNALDFLVGYIPAAITDKWADTGIPYTPQVGLMLGFGFNFAADKFAFAIRARLGNGKPATAGGQP